MSSTKEKNKVLSVIAPLSGKVVALEQVPDPVFAEKALGEGAAIIPESGKIYSRLTERLHLLRQLSTPLDSVPQMDWMFWFMSDWKQ